jgi:hypothetical protein
LPSGIAKIAMIAKNAKTERQISLLQDSKKNKASENSNTEEG